MRRKKSRSLEISERRKLLDRGIMSFDNTNHDLLAQKANVVFELYQP